MNFVRILQSIEELLYDLALWIIFIPKTFIKVVFQPKWAQPYIVGEWEKEVSERYDGYVSPILFWAVICVIPYLFMVDLVNSIYQAHGSQEGFFAKVSVLSLEAEFFSVSLFLISGPLAFSLGIQRTRRKSIGRKSMQRVFYTQCICFAPAYLFLLPAVAILILKGSRSVEELQLTPQIIYYASANLFFWWLLYAEMHILSAELGIGRLKSVAHFLAYCVLFILLLFAVEVLLVIGVLFSPVE